MEEDEEIQDISHRLAFSADTEVLSSTDKCTSRNETEKNRRDRINAYYRHIADILPRDLVMNKSGKVNKADILRWALALLTAQYKIKTISTISDTPSDHEKRLYKTNEKIFGDFVMLISVKCEPIIIFCTDGITTELGQSLSDVIGESPYRFIHDDDTNKLYDQLRVSGLKRKCTKFNERDFTIRLRDRRTDGEVYQKVKFTGSIIDVNNECADSFLVCSCRVTKDLPHQLCPFVEKNDNEWFSLHDLQGDVFYTDARGPANTGFLPSETQNMSAYYLIHKDDLQSVGIMHNMIRESGEIEKCVFRMLTKFKEYINIETRTLIIQNEWTKQPLHIISTNVVVSDEVFQADKRKQDEYVKSVLALEYATKTVSLSDDEPSPLSNSSISSSSDEVKQFQHSAELPDNSTHSTLLFESRSRTNSSSSSMTSRHSNHHHNNRKDTVKITVVPEKNLYIVHINNDDSSSSNTNDIDHQYVNGDMNSDIGECDDEDLYEESVIKPKFNAVDNEDSSCVVVKKKTSASSSRGGSVRSSTSSPGSVGLNPSPHVNGDQSSSPGSCSPFVAHSPTDNLTHDRQQQITCNSSSSSSSLSATSIKKPKLHSSPPICNQTQQYNNGRDNHHSQYIQPGCGVASSSDSYVVEDGNGYLIRLLEKEESPVVYDRNKLLQENPDLLSYVEVIDSLVNKHVKTHDDLLLNHQT